jgi:hypothetical protein
MLDAVICIYIYKRKQNSKMAAMEINERTLMLLRLMHQHDLTVKAVSDLLGRKPQTIRMWRCKGGPRVIPEHVLNLLTLRLAA